MTNPSLPTTSVTSNLVSQSAAQIVHAKLAEVIFRDVQHGGGVGSFHRDSTPKQPTPRSLEDGEVNAAIAEHGPCTPGPE